MNSKLILSAILAAALLVGCTGAHPYALTGAAVGTGVGALAGAAIDYRNPWRGAAIGGALLGATGAVAGEAYRQSQEPYQGRPRGGYGTPYGQSYGQPSYGQYTPPADQPGYYSEEGTPPQARSGSRQGTTAQGPSYQYAY